MPILAPGRSLLANDVTVKLRVSKPYEQYVTFASQILDKNDDLDTGTTYFVMYSNIKHPANSGPQYVPGETFTAVTTSFSGLSNARVISPIPQNSLISFVCNSTASLGALAIAVIGLFNIFGSVGAGALGKNFSKKYLLSIIYFGRTIAALAFIIFPITPLSVIIFSAVMGSLWLATVPLTSGIVAHIYGLQYMGTLYGIVFFSHLLGSFVGVWLGGSFYDMYGNYDIVWWVGIGVGLFSAIIHLPVNEKPINLRTAYQ